MRQRLLRACAFAGILALSGAFGIEEIPEHRQKQIWDAAPDKPRVAPRTPRRVLVFSTPAHLYAKDPHRGYCVPYGAIAIKALGEKTKAFDPVLSDELAMFLPDNIKQFDAIVLNNSCGAWIAPTDADTLSEDFRELGADKTAIEQSLRGTLLDYVSNGGGIMAFHFAIGANNHWPEFQELIGGKFTGHPWNEEVGVRVEEPSHPLVAAWGGKDFRIADEIYQYGKPYGRGKVRVLISLDPKRTNMNVPWVNQPDNDFPLAWVKTHGKGRVFYTSFGHRTELFWHPQLLQFYLDGIQFAVGDLDAPAEPR